MTKRTRQVCFFILFLLTHTDEQPGNTGKKKRSTLGNPVDIDEDGLLIDVDVQSIDADDTPISREDKRQDVDQFFNPAVVKIVSGKAKKYCICKLCP